MQKAVLTIILAMITTFAIAQKKEYKIVFDLSSGDTAIQSIVLRQLSNTFKAAPNSILEVVCHGQAINMLVKNKMVFEDRINELKSKGRVDFKVCANSMKRYNIDKSELSPIAEIVPVAILELSEKQMDSWSYIKAGY